MTVHVRATGVSGSSGRRRRYAGLVLGVAAVLAAVTACGNGGSGSGAQGGFQPAPQTGGKITVWVDSTRLPAAQLYQKQHPSVPMDIVTYDGDANGSNYLQTKVSLFNRTRSGWPDVVFSSQNNETSWAVQAGFTAPLNKGQIPRRHPERLDRRGQRPVHGRGHALLPAQRPRPDRPLVRRAADAVVGLPGAEDLGGVPGAGPDGSPPSTPATSWARPATTSPRRSTSGPPSAAPTRSPARSRSR